MNAVTSTNSGVSRFLPNWPLELWMIVATLLLGIISGISATEFIATFNSGWGRALGEFALILLPSFALAAALSRHDAGSSGGVTHVLAPAAGAGMVCPDTAYASLAPISGARKLSVAFGSYAGFKLLIPAGPLLVATGLGVADSPILVVGLILFVPVWAVGYWWAATYARSTETLSRTDSSLDSATRTKDNRNGTWFMLAPFVVMLILLITGMTVNLSSYPVLDFLTLPKGALLCAAIWAILSMPTDQRRGCLDTAISRTGSLLLIIGAASAFGAMLTSTFPIAGFITPSAGLSGIISLFILAALFKLVQGSSMATFAAVAPVAAPIVAASEMQPVAAVFAICLGSFIAILPNDSFYWLVRKDTLAQLSDGKAIAVLSGGAVLQALTGLVVLLVLASLGLI